MRAYVCMYVCMHVCNSIYKKMCACTLYLYTTNNTLIYAYCTQVILL